MSYRKKFFTVILGIIIGAVLPFGMYYLPDYARIPAVGLTESPGSQQNHPEVSYYHFDIKQGILSVVEGPPGEDGRVVITGLDVKQWPQDILLSAPLVEFNSLDEVQSFIDTVNEPGGTE